MNRSNIKVVLRIFQQCKIYNKMGRPKDPHAAGYRAPHSYEGGVADGVPQSTAKGNADFDDFVQLRKHARKDGEQPDTRTPLPIEELDRLYEERQSKGGVGKKVATFAKTALRAAVLPFMVAGRKTNQLYHNTRHAIRREKRERRRGGNEAATNSPHPSKRRTGKNRRRDQHL